MRVLVVQPGPAFSVADVYNGWVRGLRANGVEVVEYPFADRLEAACKFHMRHDGEFRQVWPFELAVLYALEPLGSWIYETQPDVVVFVSGFWFKVAPYDLIRRRGSKVVMVCTESPYEDDTQLERAGHVDLAVLNDPTNIGRFREVTDTLYVPHSYDPSLHTPGPVKDDLASDVCIVGTGYKSRIDHLEQVDWTGIDLALLGNWSGLEGHDLAKNVRAEKLDYCVHNDETVDWYRSTRASVNLYRREANRPDLSAGWSMGPREVELAATGTFFITEERGENREVFPFIPTTSGPDETTELLRWWLDHDPERQDVIVRAREAVAGWTFENRVAEVLQHLDK